MFLNSLNHTIIRVLQYSKLWLIKFGEDLFNPGYASLSNHCTYHLSRFFWQSHLHHDYVKEDFFKDD